MDEKMNVNGGDGQALQLIAGLDCGPGELMEFAKVAADTGMNALRGEVYKEKRSGEQMLDLCAMEELAEAGHELGLPVMARITSYGDMERAARLLDVIDIPASDWKIGKHPQVADSLIMMSNGGGRSFLMSAQKLKQHRNGSGGLLLCESVVLTPAYVGRELETDNLAKARESGLPLYVDISPCGNSDTAAYIGGVMRTEYGARGLLVNVYDGGGPGGREGMHVSELGKFVTDLDRYLRYR